MIRTVIYPCFGKNSSSGDYCFGHRLHYKCFNADSITDLGFIYRTRTAPILIGSRIKTHKGTDSVNAQLSVELTLFTADAV